MRNSFLSSSLVIIAAACAVLQTAVVAAQSAPAPSPFGVSNVGAYEGYNVDTVDMANGNVIVKIPLFSLPEQGRLSLSFSAIANNTMWQKQENCEGILCNDFYVNLQATSIPPTFVPWSFQYGGPYANDVGPAIVNDNIPTLAGPYQTLIPPAPGYIAYPNLYNQYVVYEPDGASHNLYYDASNNANLRATDGSGLLLNTNSSSPYFGFTSGTLVSPNGITTEWSNAKITQTDPANPTKHITYLNGDYTDTVSSRGSIHQPPASATTSALSNGGLTCPAPAGDNQPTLGSALWTVPGPSGTSTNYLICYTIVNIHTDFWDNQGQDTQVDGDLTYYNYFETVAPVNAIQAIVLPGNDYWEFTYESAQTSPMPQQSDSYPYISYGRLTGIHLPQGGTISYQYKPSSYQFQPFWGCSSTDNGLQYRTVTDRDGHSNRWTYSIYNGVVTDPNGNDTVYAFNYNVFPCTPLQQSKTIYLGSHSSGQILSATNFSYNSVWGPDNGSGPSGIGNALVTSTSTTLNGSVTTTTTTGYDSGIFTADAPSCADYGSTCTQFYAGQNRALSLGFPTSSTVTDYSGATLKSTQTHYWWQNSGSSYLTNNALNTPQTVTVFDGGNTQRAQTTTTFDESTYSSAGSSKGLLTTTSEWNNSGSPIQTHTYWNPNGMVSQRVDARGNSTSTVYDSSGIFPFTVTQPSTNGFAHVDQYSWDDYTGNMLTHIDQNNVLTQFTYADPLGRVTKVQRATGATPIESDTLFSYPSLAEVDTASDFNATGDGSLVSKVYYDGLGHVNKSSAPSGAIVRTAYDYFGQPCATSNPSYSDPGSLYCIASQNPALTSPDGISYSARDPLGRLSLVTQQDGATQGWTYSGNVTTFTDEVGSHWQRTSDALGRLTKVMEPNGTSSSASMETDYSYDTLSNLLGVTQWGGAYGSSGSVSRSFSYDSLSRLKQGYNPESGWVCYGTTPLNAAPNGSNCTPS